jgi:hypothetical protein
MSDAPIKSRRLNESGVKDLASMWRTVKGEHYDCWGYIGDFRPGEVDRLRAAGVRVRKFGEFLFVHHEDGVRAATVTVIARQALRNPEQ